jgi:hypothetical protein
MYEKPKEFLKQYEIYGNNISEFENFYFIYKIMKN